MPQIYLQSSENLPPVFSPGEESHYSVEWLGLKAGSTSIVVGEAGENLWPIVASGYTEGVGAIANVQEKFTTFWDVKSRLPQGFDLQANELGDRHRDVVRFDREAGTAMTRIQRRGKILEKKLVIPAQVHDPGSAFMALRLRKLEPGDHIEIPVFTGGKVFTLTVNVMGREQIKTPAGTFSAVRAVVSSAFGGKFDTRRDTSFWFSDDPRHIMLRASADFVIGSVVASLAEYRPGRSGPVVSNSVVTPQ